MYNIIMNIITNGVFKVSDLTTKIDTLWAESKLTDEERDELIQAMTDYLNPSTEAPDLTARINALEARTSALEKAVEELQYREPTEPGTGTEGGQEGITVPAWKAWDGINSDYQYGAVVTHNNKYFLDVLQGTQNVWEPESVGVDERYWKEITKEQAEGIISGDMTVDEVLGTEQTGDKQESGDNEPV